MKTSNAIKKALSVIITISLLLSLSTVSYAKSEIELKDSQQEFLAEITSSSDIQITPNSTMQNMEYTYIDLRNSPPYFNVSD